MKDTVSSINSNLDRVIKEELADAARLQRAREQAVEQAKTDIELARNSIQKIVQSAADLQARLPSASGTLVAPPRERWQQRLTALLDEVTEENAVQTSQQVEQLSAGNGTIPTGIR